jgi:hypothetical protein
MNNNLRASLQALLATSNVQGDTTLRTIIDGILQAFVGDVQSQTVSGTTSLYMGNRNLFLLELTANTTLVFDTPQVGVYIFKLKQGGAGSFTVTFPSNVKWAEASVPTLTTTAGAWDYITLVYDGEYFSAVPTLNFVV